MDVRVRIDPDSAKASSGVPMPHLPEPAPKLAANGRSLGRNALMLHVLAYVFFLGAWGMMLLLGELTEESKAIQGVGGAAALALALWSLLLSIRALIRAERPLLPVLNIGWVMIEVAVPCLLMWWPLLMKYRSDSEAEALSAALCLPVVVPFVVAGNMLAVPLAWWRVNRALRHSEQARAWTPRQRWLRGARWYAAIMLGLAVVAGWPLLLVFSVCTARVGIGTDWTKGILRHSPSFLKIAISELSYAVDAKGFRHDLTEYGRPEGRFLEYLACDADELGIAWVYLHRTPEGIDLARRIQANRAGYDQNVQWSAGFELGSQGRPDEVEAVLLDTSQPVNSFLDGIFRGICQRADGGRLPALKTLLECSEPYRQRMAMKVLTAIGPQAQSPQRYLGGYRSAGEDPLTPEERADIEALKAKMSSDGH